MRTLAWLAFPAVFALAGCAVDSNFPKHRTTIHVAIAHDGSTSIDGKPMVGNDLVNRAHDDSGAHFVIDAEREVSFQVLLTTLERLKAGGANDIALGTLLASSDPTAKTGAGAPPIPTGPATGPTPPPRATFVPGTKWDCPFPANAPKGEAQVLVVVHVEPDGKPVSADVQEDPGNGFGDAAKKCALDKSYVPAHDVNGQPIRAATFPFYIHFITQ